MALFFLLHCILSINVKSFDVYPPGKIYFVVCDTSVPGFIKRSERSETTKLYRIQVS